MVAKADEKEQDGIRHHLMSFLEPWDTSFNINEFKTLFWKTVKEINARGKRVIAAGGSNYYLEAILEQYMPKAEIKYQGEMDFMLRKRILSSLESLDYNEMMESLREADPEAAKLTIKNDTRRVENRLRRLIDDGSTKMKPTDVTIDESCHIDNLIYIDNLKIIVLNTTADNWLFDRLLKRIQQMVKDGGLSEAIDLFFILLGHHFRDGVCDITATMLTGALTSMTSKGVMQAIGYKEFMPYFDAIVSHALEDIDKSKMNVNLSELKAKVVNMMTEMLERMEKNQNLDVEDKRYATLTSTYTACIDTLHSHTVSLVRRQRKYLHNRLSTVDRISDMSIHADVTSVDMFASLIADACLFVDGHAAVWHAHRPAVKVKNAKVHERCQLCGVDIVGSVEIAVHYRSKGHRGRVKRAKMMAGKSGCHGKKAVGVEEGETGGLENTIIDGDEKLDENVVVDAKID